MSIIGVRGFILVTLVAIENCATIRSSNLILGVRFNVVGVHLNNLNHRLSLLSYTIIYDFGKMSIPFMKKF